KGDRRGVVCFPLTSDQTAAAFDTSSDPLTQAWSVEIMSMLAIDARGNRRYPNLYTDFADLSSFSNPFVKDSRKIVIAHWATLTKTHGLSALDRVLYGTDWSLLGRDVDFEDYYRGTVLAVDDLGL